MNPALSGGGAVEFVEVSGLFEDGWCEPVFSCNARATEQLTRCQLTVWLKPELERLGCAVRISVNGNDTMSCTLPYDLPTVVQVACKGAAGDVVSIQVSCDNLVVNKGSDLRRLSFRLQSLAFS